MTVLFYTRLINMASDLVERLMCMTEPYIQVPAFSGMIVLYSSEMVTASQIKSHFELSTDSSEELDSLLATMPAINLLNLTLTNVANRCRWAVKIWACLNMQGVIYNDASAMRTALGI